MTSLLDETDRRILRAVQHDSSLSMDSIAQQVHLSRNACWRRIKAMEDAGIIRARVALIDPDAVGLELLVFVLIRTAQHDAAWLKRFHGAIDKLPQIIGAHRMAGDLDYILRVRVGSVKDYDSFYQRLIEAVPISDVSASFVMENLKETTQLPV